MDQDANSNSSKCSYPDLWDVTPFGPETMSQQGRVPSEANAVERVTHIGELQVTYYEYGTESESTILMVHGTGLHARVWDSVIRGISNASTVIAPDLRGHGKSDRIPPYDWETYGQDLVDFIESNSLLNLIGVGHSFGGYAVTHAALECPGAFKSLVLIDPAIVSHEVPTLRNFLAGYEDMTEHPMAKRRWQWDSLASMQDYFSDRYPYNLWQPDVLSDYCSFGVSTDDDGGVRLACPPIVESLIYLSPIKHVPITDLEKLTMPVTVMRAKQQTGERPFLDFVHSFTRNDIADYLPNVEDIYLPELTHFIPMERPDLVSETIDDHVAANTALFKT